MFFLFRLTFDSKYNYKIEFPNIINRKINYLFKKNVLDAVGFLKKIEKKIDVLHKKNLRFRRRLRFTRIKKS